jgi:nucleoside 2-deoxyribosyltransferase
MKLSDLTIYIAGPMFCKSDDGVACRKEVVQMLSKLQCTIFDPTEFEEQQLEKYRPNAKLPDGMSRWKELKNKVQYLSRFKKYMRAIIRYDRRKVLQSDVIIVVWDGSETSGTHYEATLAHLNGQEVYLLTTVPVKKVPGWLIGCCTEEFRSAKALEKYLIEKYENE